MALQDLTPQLRTRLSRVERAVGVFVTLATLLMVAGLAFYVYRTAQRKGWFLAKIHYQTGVNSAEGLVPGAPVMLMGKSVGKITEVKPNDPADYYGLTVTFEVQALEFGYIWSDSKVKVASQLLGGRMLEVTKGREYWAIPTVIGTNRATFQVILPSALKSAWNETTNQIFAKELSRNGGGPITADRADILVQQARYDLQSLVNPSNLESNRFYVAWEDSQPLWIEPNEARPASERIEEIANTVEKALPNILALTNQLMAVLNNAASATAKLDGLLSDVRPAALNLTKATDELPRLAANIAQISENLTNSQGSLGNWVMTDDLKKQIEQTFGGVHVVMDTANTNLLSLNQSLENLSQITSNLAVQVHSNTNLVGGIYHLIIDADQLVQGLKQHWFLRGAFK